MAGDVSQDMVMHVYVFITSTIYVFITTTIYVFITATIYVFITAIHHFNFISPSGTAFLLYLTKRILFSFLSEDRSMSSMTES